MTAIAWVGSDALALGDATLATTTTVVTAEAGDSTFKATADSTATAVGESETGDSLATTGITSFVYASDADGTGAGVLTTTSGTAVGEDSYATSTTTSFAISTDGADVAVGICYSYATGDTYQEAEAYVDPYGDITAGHTVETDTALFDSARSIGVAVDII
ncbi:hypothetical protein [Falsiroseomonas sp.]|uniref:hypothetical protein n=1 Tax=Falsiroseomonas sp. TaxID=2870721 RepID=UPI00356461CE